MWMWLVFCNVIFELTLLGGPFVQHMKHMKDLTSQFLRLIKLTILLHTLARSISENPISSPE